MFAASMPRRSRAVLTGDATQLGIKMADNSQPGSATVPLTRLESLLGQGGRPHVLDRHVYLDDWAGGIPQVLKAVIALGVLAIIGITAWVVVGTWLSASHAYQAPASFTVSNDAVAQVVHDAIAGDLHAKPMSGSPTVNCTTETTCDIDYTVRGSPSDPDSQLIEPTRQMWKGLFTDPQFQRGTITVSGPVTTIERKNETSTYYTLTCDRDAASQINWDNVNGKGIRTLCDYQAQTQGLPGLPQTSPSNQGLAGHRVAPGSRFGPARGVGVVR
jgi:hypothetical protein